MSEENDQSMLPRVAHIRSTTELILNKGLEHGLTVGVRFLIYGLGPNIIDPVTNRDLGKLEIVRGTGTITHLQASLCTVTSDKFELSAKTIRKTERPSGGWASTYFNQDIFNRQIVEEVSPKPKKLPFADPKIGDYAKPI